MSINSDESDDKTIVARENNNLNKDPSLTSLEDQKIDRSIEKQLLRKLDMRIIPLFTLSYFFNNLEKSNIGNAKIAGLTANSGISEPDYNNALSLFYIGAILFDMPSGFLNKKIGINIWYPIILVGCASCSLSQAFVANASQLQALRFLLGVFESAAGPIQFYYYTVWYTPNEISVRAAIAFSFSMTAGAFGSLTAYAIVNNMDGLNGLHGWQWIFIIEALPPFILAAIFYFVIPKDQNHAKFLTKDEVSLAYERLQIRVTPSKLPNDVIKKQIFSVFTDFKMYLFAIGTLANSVLLNSVLLFTPTIIKEMGFDSIRAQALSAPPFIVGSIVLSFNAWLSNRNNERVFHIAIPDLIAAVGLIVTISIAPTKENIAIRYVAACITIAALISYLAVFASWMTSNIVGQYKRAVGMAFIGTIGETGGIIAGQVYRADNISRGHIIIFSFLCLHLTIALSAKFIFTRLNKKKDLLQKNSDNKDVKFEEKYNEELFDHHPNWRYLT
ncbi:18652_t:CDS:2 [Entrophospora sp. SA101]|nr:14431_t:CDS:2 [Entrophospora sp. SA101]CAJ0642430.1 12477_t:CDS:2 [Entrophospora sp. SA101]CAJ0747576.1 18652_t:CDS:2 [Entrophospora sp. SA101]CAJ0831122.1 4839_t:CDS:2 [Entrophospora sp. SA101]CAJ0880694.1 10292_t:CDS:2 [Entrophospora sp. SA101]